MNILHMRYAVEVAKEGSINKASGNLLVAQPNLSRSIRDLETELGIRIFKRSPRGMKLTPEGENFIYRAKKVLREIEEIETSFKSSPLGKQSFSISVPRASYISCAFRNFTGRIGSSTADIFYKETNFYEAVESLVSQNYNLAIVRYARDSRETFEQVLEEKGLSHRTVSSFNYSLLMSKDSPLAGKKEIRLKDLDDLILVAHGDPYTPAPTADIYRNYHNLDSMKRRIFLFERGSQLDLLNGNPETFMWASPVPEETLQSHHLIQRDCQDSKKAYQDELVWRIGYEFSPMDEMFLDELEKVKKTVL
ncbi:MAG: LysR family transcriptional regulator [Solobacterium sp.]|nr:LysR family transcriptional regulator [Solobacterium sp.]